MSFPHYGDQSAAWMVTGSFQGKRAVEDFVLTLKDRQIVAADYADLGRLDRVAVEAFVAAAVAKVR